MDNITKGVNMKENIVIRTSKVKENLILVQNCEKVYFIFLDGQAIDNNLDYNTISDNFNGIEARFQFNGND